MKKFLILILSIFLFCVNKSYSAQFNILVLPTNIFTPSRDYMIFPNSAELIANDIVNYYNVNPKMSAPNISYVKSILNQSPDLKRQTQQLFNRYNSSYEINYIAIQRLAARFKTRQVLLISCNLDTQNYFLRRTIWDFLNIPGATVIDPAYRLTTQVTLVDANNQIVLWQENYQKLISSRESRIIPEAFSPSSEQLEKVKKYSTKFIAPQIVQETQLVLMNISPYQDLNKRQYIVKPQAISIDKAKIDAKRASVRSGRFIKKESIKAAKASKKKTKAVIANQKKKMNLRKQQRAEKRQLKLIQQKKQQELKVQQALEKQALKEKIKKEQQELKAEKSKKKIIEIKTKENAKKQEKIQNTNQNINVNVEVVPSSTIMQQDLQPAPFIRTRPTLKEIDYTINDI